MFEILSVFFSSLTLFVIIDSLFILGLFSSGKSCVSLFHIKVKCVVLVQTEIYTRFKAS